MDKYLENKRVKDTFKKDLEPQEILLDNLAKKREEELGVSERKFEVPLSKRILQGFLIFSLFLFLFLFIRTFQFQILEGEKYQALAESNKFVIAKIQAERGVIYDSQGNQLVWNQPTFDLFLNLENLPQLTEERLKVLKEVSEILEKDFKELEKKVKESEKSPILISENLPHQPLILLETKITSNELPGFYIERNSVRLYQDGPTFAHLIGYTGKIKAEEFKADPENYSIHDMVGRAGLEKFYEKVLKKSPGKILVEKDALGNIISKETISLPESGNSLVLWLDSKLQQKIEESFRKALSQLQTQKAAAVALNPKTGGVMALVSLPNFDNNLFNVGTDPEVLSAILNDPQQPLFNRAIAGKYPVGSTIKPLIASAALEEKIISPQKLIYDEGFIQVPHKYDPEIIYTFEDWRAHGWVDMKKAIAESCNVYFYTIGGGYQDQEGLGPSRIKKYLEIFGWGQRTQIDLPAEESGFIPDPGWKKNYFENPIDQIWYDGDTYNLSIGQGFIKVTPLQVAVAFSALANGGTIYQPKVVQKIVDSEKNLIEEMRPEILDQNLINPESLQIVREGMRQAVTGWNSPHASAILLNDLPVKAAAKTGTAEVWKKGEKLYHTWTTVFAPYEEPEIVLTLMMEDVKDLSQLTVLPVAREVLGWYFSQ